MDIFSRYTVGFMVASCDRAALAERLLADSIRTSSQGVQLFHRTPFLITTTAMGY